MLTTSLHHSATNRQQAESGKHAGRGFTLVELIMVIALAGIVAVMISTVMTRPLQGFADQSRRAELTDLAATALNRMARDIRLAVPNSVMPTGNTQLELLAISEAGRYRANQWKENGARYDPPRCPDSGACSIPVLSPGMDKDEVEKASWMVIYNTGQLIGNNDAPAVITPNNVQFELGCSPDEPCLELSGTEGFSFEYASPQHRFYLVRDVLGYRCEDPGANANGDGRGRILRKVFDTLSGAYSYADAPLVVDSVSSCSFSYTPGTNTRNGLVTLHLSLTKGGETVSLLQQVHVDNAP
ncbi:PilW family protein [Stutzerimonas xanthomarina]|uniref:PilW family protein n=1 Tax=Stutzerimonas xanthomarina TaxID=271420 RepID=UPI003AA9C8B1